MSLDYKVIGKCIREQRKELGMSQWEVEEKADIGQKYLSNIETGRSKVSIETIIKICHVLDCTPNEFLLGTSKQDIPDFIQAVQVRSNGLDTSKKKFLLEFVELLKRSIFDSAP